MSQLLIKQKVFSWTDTYDVYDSQGYPRYFVKADMFSTVFIGNSGTGNVQGSMVTIRGYKSEV